MVHRAPTVLHTPPYVVAIIDLDEGWFMISNIIGYPSEKVDCDQRVKIDFKLREDGVTLPVFRVLDKGVL